MGTDPRTFTAEEVREIAFQIANPGRLARMNAVLRGHGISAEPTPDSDPAPSR